MFGGPADGGSCACTVLLLSGADAYTLHTVIDTDTQNTAGKRTFTSLVSKVKAKVQEFDQSRYADRHPLFFFFAARRHHLHLHSRLPLNPRTTLEEGEVVCVMRGTNNHCHLSSVLTPTDVYSAGPRKTNRTRPPPAAVLPHSSRSRPD